MNSGDSWKTCWQSFAKALEAELQAAADAAHLSRVFGGARVEWHGRIESIDFDDLAAVVNVALPPVTVTVGNGSVDELDGLTLVVAVVDIVRWNGLKVGDEITFQATLGDVTSPFPPVEIETLNSGRTVIIVRASQAVPAQLQ